MAHTYPSKEFVRANRASIEQIEKQVFRKERSKARDKDIRNARRRKEAMRHFLPYSEN